MAKIKLTKNELKKQKDALKMYRRYLPTLLLKKQQLQMEIRGIEAKRLYLSARRESLDREFHAWVGVFGEASAAYGPDGRSLLVVSRIRTSSGNIAGVEIPVFDGADFELADYDLFSTPLWVDTALDKLKQAILVDLEIKILDVQILRLVNGTQDDDAASQPLREGQDSRDGQQHKGHKDLSRRSADSTGRAGQDGQTQGRKVRIMIAAMKKVWMVVLDSRRTHALKSLRKLGMLHVETLQGVGAGHEAAVRALSEAEKVVGMLSTIKAVDSGGRLTRDQTAAIITGTLDTYEKIRLLHEEAGSLTKEHERVRDWGEVLPETLAELKSSGFTVRFFDCPAQRVATLPAELNYVRLAAPKGRVRLAVINETTAIPSDLAEFVPASRSISEITLRIASIAKEIRLEQEILTRNAARIKQVAIERNARKADLELETIRSGMGSTGPVAYLSGFAPAAGIALLTAEAKRQGWGILVDDPSDDELPPTKVENSAITRMVNPVFEFLGTVPNYREYDISSWFLGFFTLYFAMIFGDGGYGLILFCAGLVAALKAKSKGQTVPDAIRLLLLLGIATMAWGTSRQPGLRYRWTVSRLSSRDRRCPRSGTAIPRLTPTSRSSASSWARCSSRWPISGTSAGISPTPGSWPSSVRSPGGRGMFFAVLNLVVDPVRFPARLLGRRHASRRASCSCFAFGNWEGTSAQSRSWPA